MKSTIFFAVPATHNRSRSDVIGQCDCDCDCACAPVPGYAVGSVDLIGIWDATRGVQLIPFHNGWTGLHSPTGPGRLTILDRSALALWSHFQGSSDIKKHFFGEDELRLIYQFITIGLLNSNCALPERDHRIPGVGRQFSSWLHLTDRCNLRCDYCYLPHVREDMSPETGRAVVDTTFRSALSNGFKQVKLKYAGGEPLLRFSLIEELHRYAQSLAAQQGMDLEGVVLSNGTLLTARMVETLQKLDLRLMISLDGLGQYHDCHRHYLGGRGSFADVAEAVDLALANGLTPSISVTVSSRTAVGLPDVVGWILERDLPFSLNFYRENDLSVSKDDLRLDEQKIISGILAAFKVIETNLPRRGFLGGLVDRANLSVGHSHTCGVGQNYLIFNPHGQVAKCQMQMHAPVSDASASDPLADVRADLSGIQNLSVEEKEGCRECQWRYWCAGGCPLETYRATGRYDVKSPNCNIYRALFPEALRLEGLRLLKYQDDPEVVQKIIL